MTKFFSEEEQHLLKEWVVSQETKGLGKTATITCLALINGVEVLGFSYCSHEDAYDQDLEKNASIRDALVKVKNIEDQVTSSGGVWF